MARYGGGHEDYEEELRLLQEIRAQTDQAAKGEAALRAEAERTAQAADAALAKQRESQRLTRENQQFDTSVQRTARVDTSGIDAQTEALRRNVQAQRDAEAAARRAQAAMERENLVARGAAAGTLSVVPAAVAGGVAGAAASRFVIQESTTGTAVSGRFQSEQAAQRRLLSIMEEQAAIRQGMVESSRAEATAQAEAARNARSLVTLGTREMAVREQLIRSLMDLREAVDGELMGVRGLLGPGAQPPGRGAILHPEAGSIADYGPRYGFQVPPGAQGVNTGFGREGAVGGGYGLYDAAYSMRQGYQRIFGTTGGAQGPVVNEESIRRGETEVSALTGQLDHLTNQLHYLHNIARGPGDKWAEISSLETQLDHVIEQLNQAEARLAGMRAAAAGGGGGGGGYGGTGVPGYAAGPRLLGQATGGPYSGTAEGFSPEARLRQSMGEGVWGEYAAQAQRAEAASAAFAGGQARVSAETRLATAELSTASQAMYRHGALTSEFLQAALRGEVTMRELGNQVAITSLKFGGWTLAATGVYGLARAIGAVGKGAMETESTVAELGRYLGGNLNADKARQQVRDLAREMNVSIPEVSQAFTAAARVSSNQEQAASIARTTLLLSRVGDLDPQQAVGYTTALTTGFHMAPDRLALFIDQLNQLQNRMNIPFDVSAQAVSRAAGNVAAAGGTPDMLAALVAAARRGSGLSGDILGTTFQRAAQMVSRPTNRAQLRGFGINPDQNFDQIFAQAMDLTRSGAVQGRGIIQLATALSSPQLAGRGITAALSNPAQFDRARQLEDPSTARGSATRELHQLLSAVDEQVKRIGVQLATLGSALAQSGVLDPLRLMLELLNQVLRGANDILDVWNELPAPLRHSVALLGEMYAAMALMRRFGAFAPGGIVSRVSPGFAGAFDDEGTRLRRFAGRSLNQQLESARGYREQAAGDYVRQAQTAEVAYASRQGIFDAYRRDNVANMPIGSATRLARDAELEAANEAAARSTANLAQAKAAAIAAQQLVNRAEAELTGLSEMEATAIRARLATLGIPIPASMRTGEARGAGVVGGYGATVEEGIAGTRVFTAGPATGPTAGPAARAGARFNAFGGVGDVDAAAATQDIERQTTVFQRMRSRVNDAAEAMRASNGEWGGLARNASQLEVVALGSIGAAERTTSALRALPSRLGGLGRGLAGVFAALGPLDYALIGIPLAIYGYSQARDHVQHGYGQANQLANWVPSDRATFARMQARDAKALQSGGTGVVGLGIGAGIGAAAGGFVGAFAGGIGAPIGAGIGAAAGERFAAWLGTGSAAANQQAQRDQQWVAELQRVQAQARQRGGPVPQRFIGDVVTDIKNAQKDRMAGVTTMAQFDAQMHKSAIEIQTSLNPTGPQLAAARQVLATAEASTNDRRAVAAAVAGMDAKTLGTFMTNEASALESFGRNSSQGRSAMLALSEAYRSAVEQWGNSNDPTDIQNLNASRQAYYQGLQNEAQQQLQIDIGTAPNARAVQTAYRNAQLAYRRPLDDVQNHMDYARQQEAAARARVSGDRDQLRQTQGDRAVLFGMEFGGAQGVTTSSEGDVAKAKAKLAADKADIIKFKQSYGKWSAEYTAAKRAYEANKLQLRDSAFQAREQDRSTDADIVAQRSLDPLQQQRGALDVARRNLDDARRTYGANAPQTRQALDAYLTAENALNTAVISQANSLNDVLGQIAQARDAGNPLAQAADALNTARTTKIDPRDPLSGPRRQLAIIQAHNQAHDATLQNVQDHSNYLKSLTQDPVTQARDDINAANQQLALARSASERWAALAARNQAQQQLDQALQAIRDAKFGYLRALTTDPVKQAEIDVQQARYDATQAHGAAAKLQALGNLRQKQQALRDTRFQGREDDIQFNLDMQRISTQEAISQYESLAQSRGITKSVRRDLLRRIQQLKQQSNQEASGFALDVGSIKLPTIYDVRRAFGAVRGAAAGARDIGAMRVNSQVQVNVSVTDPAAAGNVYTAIDRALKTSVRASMRTAGMRG